MVRFKCTGVVTDEIWSYLNGEKRAPNSMLLAVPLDCIEELQIVHTAKNDRVAELEEELARAMLYLSAQSGCDACKHGLHIPHFCPADCDGCAMAGFCVCGSCTHGEKWEWIGANGNERATDHGSDR